MTKIELKLGNKTFKVGEKNLILDNGNRVQLVTQYTIKDWARISPKMSKKLFADMKRYGYLYTNDRLQQFCQKVYNGSCTLYAFDIQRMLQDGYQATPENN